MAVISIETFRSVADDEAFLAADGRVQTEYYYQQPGLARRTIARSSDGEWLVVATWASEEAADAAEQQRGSDQAAAAFDALIDRSSYRAKRYRPLDL